MRLLYKFRFLPLFLGILFLIVGLYYSMIKAGIPYQDATYEMSSNYFLYMNIGEDFFKLGMLTIIFWSVFVIFKRLFYRIRRNIRSK